MVYSYKVTFLLTTFVLYVTETEFRGSLQGEILGILGSGARTPRQCHPKALGRRETDPCREARILEAPERWSPSDRSGKRIPVRLAERSPMFS